jgi:hypothetical protein
MPHQGHALHEKAVEGMRAELFNRRINGNLGGPSPRPDHCGSGDVHETVTNSGEGAIAVFNKNGDVTLIGNETIVEKPPSVDILKGPRQENEERGGMAEKVALNSTETGSEFEGEKLK